MSAWESSSEETDKVIAAFVAATAEFVDITKDRTADAGTYTYKYADLAAATTATRPVLASHGLAVTQPPVVDGNDVKVATVLLHQSGQWLQFPALAMPAGKTAQQAGSALTYARRYSLMAVLGLATEDDDGAGAGERQAPVQARPEPTYSKAALDLFKEVSDAPAPVKAAVKAYAEARDRKVNLDSLEDQDWRMAIANVIDEAKNTAAGAGVEQPELAAQQ